MKLKAILFDLDGTLLPMDNDEFTKGYFKLLAKKLAPHGYEPQKLIDGIWAGTAAMVKNDGSRTNEEAFWKRFSEDFGERVYADKPVFDEFYSLEFQSAKAICGYDPQAAEAVAKIKKAGLRVVLATNPIFPEYATASRIRWAGLDPADFEFFTHYGNIGYCKPDPEYYREILKRLDVPAEQCLMVGNDTAEDIKAAEKAGLNVFLLTDCLINKENIDITPYPRGGFEQLWEHISNNLQEE